MPRVAKPHQVASDLDPAHDAGFAAASERAALALRTPQCQVILFELFPDSLA